MLTVVLVFFLMTIRWILFLAVMVYNRQNLLRKSPQTWQTLLKKHTIILKPHNDLNNYTWFVPFESWSKAPIEQTRQILLLYGVTSCAGPVSVSCSCFCSRYRVRDDTCRCTITSWRNVIGNGWPCLQSRGYW